MLTYKIGACGHNSVLSSKLLQVVQSAGLSFASRTEFTSDNYVVCNECVSKKPAIFVLEITGYERWDVESITRLHAELDNTMDEFVCSNDLCLD
jgi:hypothetical protein